MPQDHNGPLCASLGHYVAGITLAYCPHLQNWVAIVRAGDDTDDTSWRFRRLEFGPFDSREDVEREAVAELLRLLRADLQGWRARPGE